MRFEPVDAAPEAFFRQLPCTNHITLGEDNAMVALCPTWAYLKGVLDTLLKK